MLSELTTIDVKTIPFKDENVIALFSSLASLKVTSNDLLGETTGAIGLPEFGTEFVRRMLTVAQPKSFADLIRVSGLSHGKDV
jgi:DNA polymerase-3 subunit alpha (Gram-positive type)